MRYRPAFGKVRVIFGKEEAPDRAGAGSANCAQSDARSRGREG